MREILFRGKYKDTGEWVYWDAFGRTTTHTGKQHVLTVTSGAHTSYYYHAYQIMEKIDRTTVGQYTGLKDKNGKRIFEGDIVKKTSVPMQVLFDTESAQFFVRYCIGGKEPFYENTLHGHGYLEIIGNIHDNPELIGGADVQDT